MFEADIPIANEKYFQAVWRLLPQISLEALFTVHNDKIVIQAMDPAGTTMAEITLKKEFFTKLKCDNPPLQFISDVLHIGKIIRPRGQEITLTGDEDKLVIIQKDKDLERRFDIINLKMDKTFPRLQPAKNVQLAISSEVLQSLLEDVEPISDTVTLHADKKMLKVSSEGELSSMEHKLTLGDKLPMLKVNSEATGTYFHEYMSAVNSAFYSVIQLVAIEFAEGQPLTMSSIAKDEKGNVVLTFKAYFGPKP